MEFLYELVRDIFLNGLTSELFEGASLFSSIFDDDIEKDVGIGEYFKLERELLRVIFFNLFPLVTIVKSVSSSSSFLSASLGELFNDIEDVDLDDTTNGERALPPDPWSKGTDSNAALAHLKPEGALTGSCELDV